MSWARDRVVSERVVTYDPKDKRYCSLELNRRGDSLTISGTCGTVLTRKAVDKQVEDYWHNMDVEDEYGYLADEQELEDKEERERFFQNLERDLKEDDYPFEISKEFWNSEIKDDVVFDVDSAGQVDDDVCKSGIKTVGNPMHLAAICNIWKKHHLETTDEIVHKQARDLFKSFPEIEKFADDWAERKINVQELKSSHLKTKNLDDYPLKKGK